MTLPMQKKNLPSRPSRAESFLGIHFDFHAHEDSTSVGEHVDPALVEAIIDAVHPDYIQCDCKGHYGYSSYPTKVAYQAPGIVGDPLKIWREVTAEHGVALYMHYSGVWDHQALLHHPDWARINEQGEHDPDMTSVFGPYVDALLIPQLKELCDTYDVDGVWIDGDCWAARPDYSEQVLAAFQAQSGVQTAPRHPADPFFFEFMQFCREGFRQYLRHYVDTLHQHRPGFQIASNWAFSSKMPEPVSANLDFLSGDYWLTDSVNSARLEARCLRLQGRPWDLMAWSFGGQHTVGADEEDFSTKTIPQLQREAAIVLALGGGFQAYFQQDRNGAIFPWQMALMREVATFCRARQAICHRAEPVPQIALLYSGTDFYHKTRSLFEAYSGELNPLRGILQALLERQQVVDIVMEHQLKDHMHLYPLIIIPEWTYLEPGLKESLLAYVNAGGKLLLLGPATAHLFSSELSVSFEGEILPDESIYLEHNHWLARLKADVQQVQLHDDSRASGYWFKTNNNTGPGQIAASIRPLGKGRIAATYFTFGKRYLESATTVARDFLYSLVHELFPDPLVTVEGSRSVDVTVNRIQDKLAINLVNTAGPHADRHVHTFDDIPPVGPLTIIIRTPQAPTQITLEPSGTPLTMTWKNGRATVVLDRLSIHHILLVHL